MSKGLAELVNTTTKTGIKELKRSKNKKGGINQRTELSDEDRSLDKSPNPNWSPEDWTPRGTWPGSQVDGGGTNWEVEDPKTRERYVTKFAPGNIRQDNSPPKKYEAQGDKTKAAREAKYDKQKSKSKRK